MIKRVPVVFVSEQQYKLPVDVILKSSLHNIWHWIWMVFWSQYFWPIDAEEAQKKEAWREAAKKELDDWYKHHNEQVQKTRETNR